MCVQKSDKLRGDAGYPYARPQTSFIFVNGPGSSSPAAYTFDNAAWVAPSHWQGSSDHLMGLQVTGPDGGTTRWVQLWG